MIEKYAIFEVVNIDHHVCISEGKYFYCSDIDSVVRQNNLVTNGIFTNILNIIYVKVIVCDIANVTNISHMF